MFDITRGWPCLLSHGLIRTNIDWGCIPSSDRPNLEERGLTGTTRFHNHLPGVPTHTLDTPAPIIFQCIVTSFGTFQLTGGG